VFAVREGDARGARMGFVFTNAPRSGRCVVCRLGSQGQPMTSWPNVDDRAGGRRRRASRQRPCQPDGQPNAKSVTAPVFVKSGEPMPGVLIATEAAWPTIKSSPSFCKDGSGLCRKVARFRNAQGNRCVHKPPPDFSGRRPGSCKGPPCRPC
jgi:hypothetical protein